MLIPDLDHAEALLREASHLNPGLWVEHSRHVAMAARLIAEHHPRLDPDAAYVLGLLHDIGRRFGPSNYNHLLDGYRYLIGLGFADAARICLTHSFPYQQVGSMMGDVDCTEDDLQFLERYLATIQYDDYDRLIQLCDSLATGSGFVLMQVRLVDVVLRYGNNEYLVPKWRAYFAIKEDLEADIGCSVYRLLPGVADNTFGTL